ncbi:MAG: hypothetical protein HQ521_09575 [Bacteroidetes bacterium]|nr:hypothetical protein [Bacteroidota bacterium]
MDNNTNIDNLLREKFESFSPTPPEHIWNGIQKSISSTPMLFFLKNKRLIAAASILLLALLASLVIFNPFSGHTSGDDIVQIKNTEKTNPSHNVEADESLTSEEGNISVAINNGISNTPLIDNKKTMGVAENQSNNNGTYKEVVNKDDDVVSFENVVEIDIVTVPQIAQNIVNSREISSHNMLVHRIGFISFKPYDITFAPIDRNEVYHIPGEIEVDLVDKPSNSSWEIGLFISPELTVSSIDSVEILNSYNLNIEPTYFLNDHWFLRSGLGLSFVRDRGFARINYNTQVYMGSYDDVYEVTFDTILGNITPIYHTKTVEVWDSVRHISVSNVTNSYLFLQVPVLFGYSSKSSGSPLKWFVQAGPAININIGKWFENPKLKEKDAEIINLQNNLPIRANNYFQLWFGAGLEYELSNKLSIAVEPCYRHYHNNIYSNTNNKGPSSGFNLRVGLVYLIK